MCRLLAAAWDPQALPAPASIPWPEVLRLAGPSNVGVVVHTVTRGMRASMPADIQAALEQAFYRSVAANTRCLHQLARVRAGLSGTGAPLLLLKGAALAQALYGELPLRLIGDIDLAVPAPYVPACRQALLDLGYLPDQVEERPGSLLTHSNQERFEPPSPYRAPVELHWHILDVPYYLRHIPMDWFWEHSEACSIAGQSFQVLNPEANLIYLPAHLALMHRFRGLHSLLDLALLIVQNRDQFDWDRTAATAQSFDLLAALRATLDRLARCWPSLPLDEPRRLLHALTPSPTDVRLFRLLTAEPRAPLLDFYTDLASLPDLPARMRFLLLNTFPQRAYMARRYGVRSAWQLPYWYLYRLADGGLKMVRTVRQALRLRSP